MRLATFHALRQGVQSNGSPASLDQLQGVAGQLGELLSARTELFDSFEIEITDDPDRLVIALGHINADASDIVAAQAIEAIWANAIMQPEWGANAVILEDGHVELLGATLAGERSRYLTMHVLAVKSRIPVQRQVVGRHAGTQTAEGSRSVEVSFGGSTNR